MFTTLAETYMTATRVETMLGHRNPESERIALLHARKDADRKRMIERVREAQVARRKARRMQALRWIGHRLTGAGQALSRFAGDTAPEAAECC